MESAILRRWEEVMIKLQVPLGLAPSLFVIGRGFALGKNSAFPNRVTFVYSNDFNYHEAVS